jgi:hypothetical protein
MGCDKGRKLHDCNTQVPLLIFMRGQGQTIDETSSNSYDTEWHIEGNGEDEGPKELEFYVSDRDEAPDHTKHWSVRQVGTVKTTFTPEEIAGFPRKWENGRQIIRLLVKVQVNLNADTGLIQFRTLVNGREAGYTAFEYEKDPSS